MRSKVKYQLTGFFTAFECLDGVTTSDEVTSSDDICPILRFLGVCGVSGVESSSSSLFFLPRAVPEYQIIIYQGDVFLII